MIGRTRKNKRAACAARFLKQFCIVLCKTTMWNYHISGFDESVCIHEFNLCIYLKGVSLQSNWIFLGQKCIMWTRWDDRKIVTIAQMFIFKWCCLGFAIVRESFRSENENEGECEFCPGSCLRTPVICHFKLKTTRAAFFTFFFYVFWRKKFVLRPQWCWIYMTHLTKKTCQ